MLSSLALLLQIFYNPLSAMAGLRARYPYITGAVLAFVASAVYRGTFNDVLRGAAAIQSRGLGRNEPLVIVLILFARLVNGIAPILFLAGIFVPACVFAANLIKRRLGFGLMLRQEYAGLVSCVLYSWAAAHLIMLIPMWVLLRPGGRIPELAAQLAPLPYFVFLVVLAVRVTLGLSYGRAVAAVLLAGLSLAALPLFPRLLFLFTSPFLMILLFLFLRSFFGEIVSAQRARERFRQNLQAATLNPVDSSAHYNLGLIYQQRGQLEEAKASFLRATEIDPEEIDAHYQLGRIACEQGRLADAITHFDAVVGRDPSHSQNEIWREVGRAYFEAGQHDDACDAFRRFLEKRPADAEGHYRFGLALHRLGRTEEAAREMREVIECVRTAPAFKYRSEKYWMNQAQSFLRSLSAS